MPQKRPSQDEGSNSHINGTGTPVKHARAERPEDFSKAVAKKLKDSNRTGQACDRCKVRKIRCDAREGGCTPCEQNSTECVTTDRITGVATRRGHVEALEREKEDLQRRVQELERRLLQQGCSDIKHSNAYQSGGTGYDYQQQPTPTWNATNSYPPQNLNASAPQQEATLLRSLRTGTFGSNYLGVSAGNSNLSAIKGTALTILGMEIDIADFDSWDMDEPKDSQFKPELYNKSYQSFLQTALNINPRIAKVELPERGLGFQYADWYFRALNPYTPLLHKPTFMALLARFYDDSTFRPTAAENVIVHMVFAIMLFQFSVRNNDDMQIKNDFNLGSNAHYHYSLGMFYQLSCSHTFQDVQAMTLICLHLRNFPKPGASWILTQTTMSLALELGLHLSAKRWVVESKPNYLDIEMRKRTFWILLVVHVTLSGKLGRPMMLRLEDFDVEFPEAIDDDLLSEAGLDTSAPGVCQHEIGLVAMRLLPLFIELYSTIYAVRRYPENYISTVKSLEAKIHAWRESLPIHLQVYNQPVDTPQHLRPFALYAEMWVLEFRLLLRHPSVEMTDDKAFKAESMRACADCARDMLNVVLELQSLNALDTTWYNSAVYVMGITATLFATHDKKEITHGEITVLRSNMEKWLGVMGDVGRLLGSGDSLKDAVRAVIEGTLGMLERRVTPSHATYLQNSNAVEDPKAHLQRPNSGTTHANMQNYAIDHSPSVSGQAATEYSQGQMAHHSTPYPTATQYSTYAETPTTIAYTPHDNTHAYTNYPPDQQNSQWHRPSPMDGAPGQHAWYEWTSKVGEQVEPQDHISATALMSLGGQDNAAASAGQTDMNSMQPVMGYDQPHLNSHLSRVNNDWPESLFNINLGQGNLGQGNLGQGIGPNQGMGQGPV
ncbi:fungal-specific transcription factor domain-containing protein [Leptodontidium sp. 2 PMI_412]|nr:fungal-specific transcription factor domain-containing protein [Leptodontidium sp. 2 PMI_412]